MKIIENIEEYNSFINSFDKHGSVLVPVFSDSREHPGANTLCVLGVSNKTTCELVILPFDHPEANNLPAMDLSVWDVLKNVEVHRAVEFAYVNELTEPETYYSPIIRQIHERNYNNRNVNRSVPLYKWAEYIEKFVEHLHHAVEANGPNAQYEYLRDIAIPALNFIESSGLHVVPDILVDKFGTKMRRFIKDDLVYSQYNLFTSTGRPSCRFGGINFAALNKDDGSRAAFTSRFEGGKLVLIDFESYHVRLIADMIDYKLPTTPAHEYFGKQYFQVDKLTDDQYNESKVKTFHLLYSDTDSMIPFFRCVKQHKDYLWKQINEKGFITSPIHKIEIKLNRIWKPSSAKVFNYLIQLAETERNLTMLGSLMAVWDISKIKSKIILYNYDAILIDLHPDDAALVKYISKFLEGGKKFPVRIKVGKNYNEMEYR